MDTSQVRAAVDAAKSTASALGLRADDAVVLQNSNRLALHLTPCDVLARVAPAAHQTHTAFEVEVARRLTETGAPFAGLDPRVEPRAYMSGGFTVTLWTHYEPISPHDVAPAEYAQALNRLHAGLREIDIPAPHFKDRVGEAQSLVESRARTPELGDADREFAINALRKLRASVLQQGAPEQLLHGEPHPGNVLSTRQGLLFVDFETACYGPVEFDLAHAPEAVTAHYPGLDRDLVEECRVLMLAMVAAWRWDRNDQFPDGRQMGTDLLRQLRSASDRFGLDYNR
jgi:aminoglycoside phosphotransferase (APT) family kinase protein